MKKSKRTDYALPGNVGIYTDLIEATLEAAGRGDVDASEIEAWMRESHGTMDHLDRAALKRAVRVALKTFDAHGSVYA